MRLGGHLSTENPTRQLNPPLPVVLFQSNTEEARRRRFHRRGGAARSDLGWRETLGSIQRGDATRPPLGLQRWVGGKPHRETD